MTTPRLVPGSRIDRYEVVRQVARGGMGTVWLARARGGLGVQRLVAVKTMHGDIAGDPQLRAMFLDEVGLAARLDHPHVARVLDAGDEGGALFMVLEWVDGDSLEELACRLERAGASVPVAPALRIVADACEGLHAAHELRGDDGAPLELVHRDVSPHNVLVSRGGVVKLIDFGVARARLRVAAETASGGGPKGKLLYMAPEQRLGAPVDRRADVWAMGAVLHRLLTGAPPRASAAGNGAPLLPDELAVDVRAVLERALAFAPDARYPSADAMQRDLEAALAARGARVLCTDVARALHGDGASTMPSVTPKETTTESGAPPVATTREATRPTRGWPAYVASAAALVVAIVAVTRQVDRQVGREGATAAPADPPLPASAEPTPVAAVEAIATAQAATATPLASAPAVRAAPLGPGSPVYCGSLPGVIARSGDTPAEYYLFSPDGQREFPCAAAELRPRKPGRVFPAGERVTVRGVWRGVVVKNFAGERFHGEEHLVKPERDDPNAPRGAVRCEEWEEIPGRSSRCLRWSEMPRLDVPVAGYELRAGW
jgi:protein kinase-like protein